MDMTYWYLFPAGIIIAALAMSAGISGANFWIPVYLFFVDVDAYTCFWLALLTMVFGFGSGVVRNIYQGSVNWYMVKQYLIPTLPGAVIGSLLASRANENSLVLFFGSFIFIYGTYMLIGKKKESTPHQKIFWGMGFAAGFLKGLIATGLGKLIVPGMWDHERINHQSEVIGSAVVIIFIVDVVAALTRMNQEFTGSLVDNRAVLLNVLMFVLPAVVIGGQVGPRAIRNVDTGHLKTYIALILIFVSILIFSRYLIMNQ